MTTDPRHDEPAAPSEYVGRTEAADLLGISTRQLDRLVADDKLTKYVRPVGRNHVAYKRADLTALLELAAAEND